MCDKGFPKEVADSILERLACGAPVDGCVGEDQSDTDDDEGIQMMTQSWAHDDTDSTTDDECEYPNAPGAPGESTQASVAIGSSNGLSDDLARVRCSGCDVMVRLTNDLNKIQKCNCKERKSGITTKVVSL